MNWYKFQSLSDLTIIGPTDGSGHMTSDDKALIWEARSNGKSAGYILVVFPLNKPPFVGQVAVDPSLRRNGIAWKLYQTVDQYLKDSRLEPLRPSRDLSPASKGLWDKRLSLGVR